MPIVQRTSQNFDQIRHRIDIDLTSEDIPDSIIDQPAYLRLAELQVYDILDVTEAAFDEKTDLFKERAQIATIYRTAALMIYSFPQVIEEEIVTTDMRWSEIDLEKKYELLMRLSEDILGDDIVNPPTSGVEIVSELVNKRLCF